MTYAHERQSDSLILREIYDYILQAWRQFETKLKYKTLAGYSIYVISPAGIRTQPGPNSGDATDLLVNLNISSHGC